MNRQGRHTAWAFLIVLGMLISGEAWADEPAQAPTAGEAKGQEDEDAGESPEEGGEAASVPASAHPALRVRPKKAKAKKGKKLKNDPAYQQELRDFIELHLSHANGHDLAAYVDDFLPEHPSRDEIEAYAQRAIELEPKIELLEFEVQAGDRKSARVMTIQRARYRSTMGEEVDALSEVIYRIRSIDERWRIDSTARQRLFPTAEELTELLEAVEN